MRDWFRDLPIRRKLVVVMTATSGTALVMATVVLLALDAVQYREDLREELETIAAIVGDNTSAPLEFLDPASARETLSALEANAQVLAAGVYDAEGRLFADYRRTETEPPLPARLPLPTGSGDSVLELVQPILLRGDRVGTIYVRGTLSALRTDLRTRALTLGLVLLAAWLMTLLLASWLQRLIADPLVSLAGTARQVSADQDYSRRAAGHGRDEIGLLVTAFNEMLSQIQRRDAELLAGKETLEQRVAERTRQLEHELTERQRAEAALAERNEELVATNRELDDFAYVASHDLKEPLRGIRNYSAFLLQDHGDRLDAAGRAKLETLVRLSRRMETLIESLLQYSRLGRAELATERVEVGEVVAEVLDTLGFALQERRMSVRVGPLPAITTDRIRLGEVFSNLISNAMKYNDKPDPWVEVGRVVPDPPAAPPGSVTFFVRDNGIGIAERHLESVFRIFKRLHGRDQFGGGTGAGLTIVRKIVERLHGRVWIDSTPGEGTTVYFSLPERGVRA